MVAFLDESILNLRNPVFADWPRKPLQEELFGHHMAGEIFFQNLQPLAGAGRFDATRRRAGGLPPVPAAGLRGPVRSAGSAAS